MRIIFEGGEILDLNNINKIVIESQEEKEVIINAQLDRLKSEMEDVRFVAAKMEGGDKNEEGGIKV